jgi:sugar lactone lactonase YvrE
MRRTLTILASLVFATLLVLPGLAAEPFPEVMPLPDGFRPEGIAIGPGNTFYVGSIGSGAVYRGDLRTGEGDLLVQPVPGRAAIGVDLDRTGQFLFVAGGPTGQGYVYDAQTGAELAVYQFTTAPTFVNDVVVTRDAAYFTDSQKPVLYRVPIGPGGELGAAETIPLGGDFQFVAGQFNANGIDATPDGSQLIVVNSTLGLLYRVDPNTGVAALIDLGGAVMTNGDGILLDGLTLYVVRNRLNQVAVIELSDDLAEGDVVGLITSPNFDVPTTIAEHGNRLYAVNARFSTPPTPTTTYSVVQVEKQ